MAGNGRVEKKACRVSDRKKSGFLVGIVRGIGIKRGTFRISIKCFKSKNWKQDSNIAGMGRAEKNMLG
ncbi:unnamed protein product [Meloidogyne enterolobii]|uniref:Uncharacterized protein n=1 Tax=Meloidogyne enterolobii TaxID=390850 RepID=A0ACB0Y373_MELEN